ncbi:MAG: serine/threonine protein kinase, partial [Planctomycetales bacterium]|nr:serine/threonine protein kinase [Planctomycetales bacterium]
MTDTIGTQVLAEEALAQDGPLEDATSVVQLEVNSVESASGDNDDSTMALGFVGGVNTQPKQLGPYVIEAMIGRGAMGTVYRAEHIKLKRKVALKIVPPELTSSPQRRRRFQREMEAVGRLDHPNLVRATDAGEVDGTQYLVMELVDAVDLSKRLRRSGPFDVGSMCEVGRQVAIGLEHIANNKLVHRDIKPS